MNWQQVISGYKNVWDKSQTDKTQRIRSSRAGNIWVQTKHHLSSETTWNKEMEIST